MIILMMIMVFLASLGCVFFLGLNSRVMRDEKIMAAAILSWMITVSQFTLTWAVFHANLDASTYILCAGLGGSIGITSSHYFYVWAAAKGYLGGD